MSVTDTGSTISPTDDSTIPGILSSVNLPVPTNTPSHSMRPPLTPLPVASAITPRIIHIPDPSEIQPPKTTPLSSRPRIIPVARKSQSFRHRKSLDSSFAQIKLPTLSLQKADVSDIDNPYISEESNKTSDKVPTDSELSSETFSFIYPKICVTSYSSSSVNITEDQPSSQSFEPSSVIHPTHTYNLRSRQIVSSQSQRTRSTSSSISALLRQHAQPRSSTDTETRSSLQISLSFIPYFWF